MRLVRLSAGEMHGSFISCINRASHHAPARSCKAGTDRSLKHYIVDEMRGSYTKLPTLSVRVPENRRAPPLSYDTTCEQSSQSMPEAEAEQLTQDESKITWPALARAV